MFIFLCFHHFNEYIGGIPIHDAFCLTPMTSEIIHYCQKRDKEGFTLNFYPYLKVLPSGENKN